MSQRVGEKVVLSIVLRLSLHPVTYSIQYVWLLSPPAVTWVIFCTPTVLACLFKGEGVRDYCGIFFYLHEAVSDVVLTRPIHQAMVSQ